MHSLPFSPALCRRLGLALLLTCISCSALSADAEPHPVIKRKINLPPSAELHYSIEAKQSGLQVSGTALVKWQNANDQYSVNAETRAMLIGKILDTSSAGGIDEYGLAPTRFVEQHLRREASTTTFNRERNTISFTQSNATYPLKGGEQDRTSIIWQLSAVARGNTDKFTTNSEWLFFVAGPRDAEQWRFKVIGQEKIKLKQGEVNAVHVSRSPSLDHQGQKLDIWLAPSSDWYPLRLRLSEPDGDFIEQTLDQVNQ